MTKRFFLNQPFTKNLTIALPKDELRHFKVMHVKGGEEVELVDGNGHLAIATFDGKKNLTVNSVEKFSPPPYDSVIIQAFTEGAHLDVLLEKGCELGVTKFILFPAKQSKKQALSKNRIERAHRILVSAIKQCKRLYIPEITILDSLDDLEDLPKDLYLADPRGKKIHSTPESDCAIFIGPEKGFTEDEIDLITNDLKATQLNLSSNILRCETASIVSAFILSCK